MILGVCGRYREEIYIDKSGYTMQTMESEDYEKEVWKIVSFQKIIWRGEGRKVPYIVLFGLRILVGFLWRYGRNVSHKSSKILYTRHSEIIFPFWIRDCFLEKLSHQADVLLFSPAATSLSLLKSSFWRNTFHGFLCYTFFDAPWQNRFGKRC